MAQPWASTVEQLRGSAAPAAPAAPTPTEWTQQKLRTGTPTGFDRPPGGVPRSAPYSAPFGASSYPPPGTGTPTVSQALGAERRLRTMSTTAGRAVGSAAAKVAPIALAADVGSHFNDFKINDPSVDSSASGTFGALRKGDFAGAGRSMSKGMLETGMDLGSAAANIADVFVPGKAPVSSAYGRMLRSTFGDQLVDNTGAPPAGGAPSVTTGKVPSDITAPPTASLPQWRDQPTPQTIRPAPATGNAAGTFRYADGSTGKGTVSSLDTIGVEGYQRQLANIRALDDGSTPALAGGIGGGRIGDTLRAKTDAGRVPAGLSARQAAGFQQQEADRVQRGELATAQLGVAAAGQNQGLRIAEMNNATQRDNNAATTRVALRGHELDYQGRMAPIEVARQQRLRAATYMGGGGATADGTKPAGGAERYAAAAQAAAANGDDALAQHFSSLATSEQARGSAVDTQAKERAATTERLFKPHYTKEVVGANGVVTQQFDEIGAAKAAARLRGQFGEQWDRLPEAEKAKHIGAAAAKERNAAAERQVTPGFVDRALDTVGLYRPPPAIESGERPLAGGQLDTGGPLTSRASRKDTVVRLRDGSVINYGEANSDQLADIQQRLRAGK